MNRAAILLIATCIVTLVTPVLRAGIAGAQDAPSPTPVAAEPESPATPTSDPDGQAAAGAVEATGDDPEPAAKSIGGMIVSGGRLNVVFFGILGIFSLWAATVVLERSVNLRRDKLLPESFSRQLRQIVEIPQASPHKFQQLCESQTSPAARIFHAGVLRSGRSVTEVEKAMEDAAAREMATLRARSRPLSVVGNIAPLVGLLGTVVGMIIAFQISSQEGLGKAERLAEGIYLALMTTAAGLTIAIPCLLFASWFQTRAERYMCDIDECLMESIPSFARMEGATGTPALKPPGTTSHGATHPNLKAPNTAARETSSVSESEMSPRERFLNDGLTGTVQG